VGELFVGSSQGEQKETGHASGLQSDRDSSANGRPQNDKRDRVDLLQSTWQYKVTVVFILAYYQVPSEMR
jgi:hypothetical protein